MSVIHNNASAFHLDYWLLTCTWYLYRRKVQALISSIMFFPIMVCVMFRKICTLTMCLSKTNWLELQDQRASLVAQLVKNPPATREIWVWSLGCKDPLEEGMATHSGILACRIPMDRRAWHATVHGVTKSQNTTERLSTQHTLLVPLLFYRKWHGNWIKMSD